MISAIKKMRIQLEGRENFMSYEEFPPTPFRIPYNQGESCEFICSTPRCEKACRILQESEDLFGPGNVKGYLLNYSNEQPLFFENSKFLNNVGRVVVVDIRHDWLF